jgi:hypothetical protein
MKNQNMCAKGARNCATGDDMHTREANGRLIVPADGIMLPI